MVACDHVRRICFLDIRVWHDHYSCHMNEDDTNNLARRKLCRECSPELTCFYIISAAELPRGLESAHCL